MKKLLKDEKGFTIIEVLIVLAIAGLIMLIVFLAVPALQRNSRNTQRTNDASLIGGAINDCLANRNGQTTACDTTGELTALGLDTTKLRQLVTVNVTNGVPTDPGSGVLNTINVGFGRKCNTAGSDVDATAASSRQIAALYRFEVQGNNNGSLRCIDL